MAYFNLSGKTPELRAVFHFLKQCCCAELEECICMYVLLRGTKSQSFQNFITLNYVYFHTWLRHPAVHFSITVKPEIDTILHTCMLWLQSY